MLQANSIQIEGLEIAMEILHLYEDLKNETLNSNEFLKNNNTKLILSILYFALVAFPNIDHSAKSWLYTMLKRLHYMYGRYLEKCEIEYLITDDQFHLLQYYIKSLIVLKIDITDHDNQIINKFLEKRFLSNCINRLHDFVHRVMWALSDSEYINKIKKEQNYFVNEDLMINLSYIIDIDFMINVFTTTKSDLLNDKKFKINETNLISEFNIYKDITELTIFQFNESNYLDKHKADYYMSLCEDYSYDYSMVPPHQDRYGFICDSIPVSIISNDTNLYLKDSLIRLLGWFTLIYERKFIFGNPDSKI
ncbi:hypothetical protein RF11_07459 [Thelohanellus kitauei]|uniref:Uncharacterized protein n=1 Tax=Thelohanellus kitauei TaxID=669202 RepID=A0A0C2N0P0_THEKT|nr:hypothetical protein RF11_07459 [Thelohanellus kitauei]